MIRPDPGCRHHIAHVLASITHLEAQTTCAEMLTALSLGAIATFPSPRLGATEPLKHNGVFPYLTGLPGYPDSTSLRRFLQRFAQMGRVRRSFVRRRSGLNNLALFGQHIQRLFD